MGSNYLSYKQTKRCSIRFAVKCKIKTFWFEWEQMTADELELEIRVPTNSIFLPSMSAKLGILFSRGGK